jgi:hypothetical protein
MQQMKNILRKWFWISAFILQINTLTGQVNLIPNASFEDTIAPSSFLNIGTAIKNWNSLDSTRVRIASGAYWSMLNLINGNSSYVLPANYWFRQFPHSGNGVISLLSYYVLNLTSPPNYKRHYQNKVKK